MTFNRDQLPDPVSYFESRGHKTIGKHGKRFRTVCAIHGGDGFNMSVVRETGGFYCFTCGAHGGDIVAHEMQVNGVDFVTAAKALGAWVNDGRPANHHKPSPLSPRDALTVLAFESMLVAVAAGNIAYGVTLTDNDRERCQKAAGRINEIRGIFQ